MAQLVRELMTTDPVALPPGTPVREAAPAMREQGIGDVFVVKDERLRGIVTDRDIVIRGVADFDDLAACTRDDVCSDQLVTVAPNEEAETAVALMRETSVRRIPVVEDGRLVGVLSLGQRPVGAGACRGPARCSRDTAAVRSSPGRGRMPNNRVKALRCRTRPGWLPCT